LNKKGTYLVITPFFPSNESFVGSYIYDQVSEIQKQTNLNIEIVKVVSYFSSESDYTFNGFKINIFKHIDFPYFIFPGFFNSWNKKRFSKYLCKKNITDIFFSHSHVSYPAAYLVENLICKKIVQHHGLDALQLTNGRFNLFRRIQRDYLVKNTIKHLNKVDLNVGVSKKVLRGLRNYDMYNPKDEIVLYNGVDRSKFYYIPRKKKNKEFTIGCVANFWKIKDHISLIIAVKLLVDDGFDCKLRLIGSGPTYSDCYNFVLKHNLHNIITFEKEKKHEQLNDFFNNIDLFVLPSYYEAFGCVYMEAWATNTPFIAIQEQGISEIMTKEKRSTFLTEKENPFVLKEKIEYIAKNNIEFTFNSDFNLDNTIYNFLRKINILREC
jgi:glycosyltransferase involved in cell wall biosynthesis